MERKLIKTLVYSFCLALLVAFIYYPDTIKHIDGGGSYSTTELSIREYLFIILRFSIKIALSTLVVVWLWLLKKTPETEGVNFTKGLIKSFLLSFILFIAVAAIGMLIFN
jgi:hypothetical protein